MSFRSGALPRTPPSVVKPSRDAMVASQQAHIDDLVQRNRTLEQTCKELREELLREDARAKDALRQVQTRWHQESAEWREGCDTLLACNRIAQLRISSELDRERLAIVKQEDLTRREKVARFQRDYKITMFQVREMELDDRVAELEDELAVLMAQADQDTRSLTKQHELVMQKLVKKCGDLSSEVAHRAEALSAALKERDDIEAKSSSLREEIARLRATTESTTSKLERISLQLEGAQTANAELEHMNADLKRTEIELKRQLDKWQNLETKGGAEVDAMRKRRIELEVQVKELQKRLDDAGKEDIENAKVLEKEKRKVDKLKAILLEWKQAHAEAQEDADKRKAAAEEAALQLAQAQKQIAKLKAKLEIEGARAGKQSSRKQSPDAAEASGDSATSSEGEVVQEIVKPSVSASAVVPKPRPKPKAVSKPQPSENKPKASSRKTAQDAKAKNTRRQEASEEENGDLEASDPKPVAKGKGKRPAVPTEDSDLEIVTEKPNGRGKAKAKADGRSANREASQDPRDDKRKANQRADSVLSTQEEQDADITTKKKKRKINIFGPAKDSTFGWDQMPQGDNELGIPTILSPVKETEAIPNRSASILGRVGSVIGSFRR